MKCKDFCSSLLAILLLSTGVASACDCFVENHSCCPQSSSSKSRETNSEDKKKPCKAEQARQIVCCEEKATARLAGSSEESSSKQFPVFALLSSNISLDSHKQTATTQTLVALALSPPSLTFAARAPPLSNSKL